MIFLKISLKKVRILLVFDLIKENSASKLDELDKKINKSLNSSILHLFNKLLQLIQFYCKEKERSVTNIIENFTKLFPKTKRESNFLHHLCISAIISK